MNENRARLVEISDEEYFANRERLSNSAIGLFLEDQRAFVDYWYRGAPSPRKGTAATSFGSLFHAMLFEPDTIERYAVEPRTYGDIYRALNVPDHLAADDPVNRNSKAYKMWVEAQEGRTIVAADDAAIASAMVNAIANHEQASEMVFDPSLMRERVIYWTCPVTGRKLRAKIDGHVAPSVRPLIVELKTIEGRRADVNIGNADWFRSHCWRFGYHRQAAVELDAYYALYGVNAELAFVFVEKRERAPAVSVQMCHVDSPFAIVGREGRTEDDEPVGYIPAIRKIEQLEAENDWRLDCERGLQTLRLPAWRERQFIKDNELHGFDEVPADA